MSESAFAEPSSLMKQALSACSRHFSYLLLFSAAINLLYIAPSLFMIQVYDRVLTTGGLATLGFLCLLLVVALATLAYVDAMRMRLLSAASRRMDRILSPTILSAALAERRLPHAVRSQFLRDFDAFRGAITSTPAIAVADAPWALLYIGVCFLIHPAIGALALFGSIAMALIAVVNNIAITPTLERYERAVQAQYVLQSADAAYADIGRSLGMIEAITVRQRFARDGLGRIGEEATNIATRYMGSASSSASRCNRRRSRSARCSR